MDIKLLHEENATSPIEVTDEGISTEVRFSHNSNAVSPIAVTESGMRYIPDFPSGQQIKLDLSLLNKTPSDEA